MGEGSTSDQATHHWESHERRKQKKRGEISGGSKNFGEICRKTISKRTWTIEEGLGKTEEGEKEAPATLLAPRLEKASTPLSGS